MKGRDVLFSKDIQTYSTPQALFDWVDSVFHFTLDACADKSNHKCSKYYTEETNGLLQSWENETVWVNPPYKFAKDWVIKARNEVIKNNCNSVVMLIPARTETKIFHEIIAPELGLMGILLLKGRLKFSGNKQGAPFPSALVVISKKSGEPYLVEFISFIDYRVDNLEDRIDRY